MVQEILTMIVAQVLGSDHPVKICFQKLLDEVDCFVFTAKREVSNEGQEDTSEKERRRIYLP